jgi:hypothetical protein
MRLKMLESTALEDIVLAVQNDFDLLNQRYHRLTKTSTMMNAVLGFYDAE